MLKALKKHAESAHKQKDTIRCQDPVRTYSSIKVLHGVCQQEKLFSDKKDFIALALKLLCKTPNKAIVESLGSVLLLHMSDSILVGIFLHRVQDMAELPRGMALMVCMQCTRCWRYCRARRR